MWVEAALRSLILVLLPGIFVLGVTTSQACATDAWPLFVIRLDGEVMANGDIAGPILYRIHHESPALLRIRSLLGRSSVDEIVFLRDGKTPDGMVYAITDVGLVKQMRELFRPGEEVNKQLEQLSQRPNKLGEHTGDFAQNLAALARRRPKGMTMEAFYAALARLDDDNDQSGTDVDFKRDMLELKHQQRALAAERDVRGKEQDDQIAEIKRLFDKEGSLNAEAQTKARTLIEQSLANGTAKPIDP